MSNIKQVRITADVPFDYLNWKPRGGLPVEEIAVLASALLAPSIGLEYAYEPLPLVPNDHGGHTAMYRLVISGEEALSVPFMERMVMALKNSDPLAKVHIAEARDMELHYPDPGAWFHIVDKALLSGEAVSR